MKRWLPSPLMSAILLLTWLLLNQSVSPGQILLGVALAIGLPLLGLSLQPYGYPRILRPLALFRLLSWALMEIIRSAFNVSRIILFGTKKGLNSQFIHIPLELRNPFGLALLSCLINSTPGTVWVELLDDNVLVLHVFDLQDEQWWIDTIKSRYERPLIDIFEGGRSQ
jgi:multicomponent K+:H+ antiporter subunit E